MSITEGKATGGQYWEEVGNRLRPHRPNVAGKEKENREDRKRNQTRRAPTISTSYAFVPLVSSKYFHCFYCRSIYPQGAV